MGASSWIYYVPYQENIERSFQALRQHIFETDNYHHNHWHRPGEVVVDICGEEFDVFEMQEVVEQEDGSLLPIPPIRSFRPSMDPIEEVVARCGGEGTHSILDISSLITDSSYYGALLLPEEILQQFFADARPTRAVVEAQVFHEDIWSWVDRWLDLYTQQTVEVMQRNIYGLSEGTLHFFAVKRSKQELVEVFLAEETLWMNLHRLIAGQIEHLAMRTRVGRAMPLSSKDLNRFFGSEKPIKAEVEAAFREREIWGIMRRGVGYYAVIYQDGVPQEIVFAGFSGD